MAGKAAKLDFFNRIHGEDCVAGMNRMPEGCADLVFADPPFNIGYDYDVYDDNRDGNQYLSWSREWISAVKRVLKPNGTFWLAIGDEYAAELKVLSQELGFHCRSWVVWYYTFGVNCKYKFSRSHVHLFHFVKDRKSFTFRGKELENRVPSARQLVYADSRAAEDGRLPDDTWILRPQDLPNSFTAEEDTWYFPRVAGTFKERAGFHGCQMPEQLLGRIIRLCSHEDEIVLDPFSGSATTLVVAKKLGRRFAGFELSPEYAERGANRLEQVRRGDPLEGSPEPTVSAPATPGKVGKKHRGAENAAPNKTPANSPAPVAIAETLFENGLLEAYRRVSDGFSLDRVIADPDMNQRLAEECQTLGLPGDARVWNWRLFNFRKAGKLAAIPTTQRTAIGWKDCDSFLFASEIALSKMLAEGAESLDAILCDHEQAQRFDAIANEYAPGFTSLQYRWAALKLRKEAKFARARAKLLSGKGTTPGRLTNPLPVIDAQWDQLKAGSGVYLVSANAGKSSLYVGESLDLPRRLQNQFQHGLLKVWQREAGFDDLSFQVLSVEPRAPELFAYQSLLVAKHKPMLNLRDLAA